jgi:hypothetical protein
VLDVIVIAVADVETLEVVWPALALAGGGNDRVRQADRGWRDR